MTKINPSIPHPKNSDPLKVDTESGAFSLHPEERGSNAAECIKKILSLFLRVGVSIFLLVILFRVNKIDLGDLAANIRHADKFILSAGFLLFGFVYLLGFLRWRMLLRAAGVDAALKKMVSSFSGGVFFSIFLPSTIGGDLVRAADLTGHTRKAREVIATVFLDRLSGYIGMAILIMIALFLGRGLVLDKVVLASVSAILMLLCAILLVLFNNTIYSRVTGFLSRPGAGRIEESIRNMHREIYLFRHQKKLILLNICISFIVQLISPLSTYLIALSLGIKLDFIYFAVLLPVIGAITLLPISIGGLGLREGLFVVYFAKVGVAQHTALTMSLLSFSYVVVYAALGGIIYVLTVHYRRLQPDKPSRLQAR